MEKITHKIIRLKCRNCSFDQEMIVRLESPVQATDCPHCLGQNTIFVSKSKYACPTCASSIGSVRIMLIHGNKKFALCKCDHCNDASEVTFVESHEEVV